MTPRALMSLSAAALGAAGLALLFAPVELQRLGAGARPALVPPLLLQLWGGGLLGLAAANWTGRGLTLGGIYGRALVLGNAMHWTVGSLSGLRAALGEPTVPALWVATGLYGVFALGFARLLRRHPGPAGPAGSPGSAAC